ncbi:MAG: N-acetylmuramoyl-L-alanine amidase [Vicinamibacteria bacterium]|nr:N-acetylmuramoyl-L-alanine amidase [Vicinamibacteria bacterium]
MRVITAFILAVLGAVSASEAAAQTTARGMFTTLQSREQATRRALDGGRPERGVRRDVERVVVGYEGLVARFPRNGYADNALWQAAFLAADSFARYRVDVDRQTSVRLLRRLAKEYPTSPLIKRADPALKRLMAAAPAPPPAAPAMAGVSRPTGDAVTDGGAVPAPRTPGVARIQAIRRTVLPDVVRIAIELDQEIEYRYERIDAPVRVFLDLAATEVAPTVALTTPFDDLVVKSVRLGPRPGRATRVVLDLEGTGRHAVFTLYNPYRIVVDIDRRTGAPEVVAAVHTAPAPPPLLKASAAVSRGVPPAAAPAPVPASLPDAPTERVRVPADEEVHPAPPVVPTPDGTPAATPLPARRAAAGAASSATLPAPAAPSANAEGRFSLSRQLGLGINRIVIDPGHGGHDPGTKSRSLSEAELVLDVAKRVEALLLNEPGVEVMLTRRTDVFVPLEERTAIANREGADLFLSIHANSSRNNKAGGVETYFLNFASNPDAEAVAARENSASGRTMHSLPDIVKAITLNNKLDESRDFATLVQRAMIESLAKANGGVRDRGVKQAPFVVLIGAGMPSVLAEIAFMTHSQEGRLLKTPAYRQRVAEALFQGIRRYQRSLKAVTAVASQD